ncbi:hypothetical protein [Streptomyces sp. NPDC048442]|uniref:hypothetical protein n=1 Tax=Streptomyces sp. NPDC048442 TaxID=3154823 RepID=UPI0034202F76
MTVHKQDDSAEADSSPPAEETLAFDHPGGDSLELADLLTGHSMVRRLPSLIRRTMALAWAVDRRTVLVLVASQIVSGASGALGLLATTQPISVLIATATEVSHSQLDGWSPTCPMAVRT